MMSCETWTLPAAMATGFSMTFVTIMMTATTTAAQNASRTQPAQIEWNLNDIYPTVAAWNAAKDELEARVAGLAVHRGHLGDSAAALREAFDAIYESEKELSRLYVFAFLKADEDRRVAEDQERARGWRLPCSRSSARSWRLCHRSCCGSGRRRSSGILRRTRLWRNTPSISGTLSDRSRTRSPTKRSKSSQRLDQSCKELSGSTPMLTSSDLPFPKVTLSNGEEVTLDQAAYSLHRASQNRNDRKLVFDEFWGAWKAYETSIGQTLDTHVKAHVFQAKARRYENALTAALSGDNIPIAVYRNLITAAHRHLPSLHRYFRLRQRMLGLDDLHYYDIYPPLVASDRTFNVDESKVLTLASAAPLGRHYQGLLEEGFAGSWMHVYPQTGKAPGAYMYGSVYDVHPFLLLNHNGQFNDVSTFTHEWGHAIHTMLSHGE